MSYEGATLIARSGYAGMGAVDAESAATYCGGKFGVTSPDFQPCVDFYKSGKSGDYQPASSGGGSSGGGIMGSIFGAVSSVANAAGSIFGAKPTVAMPYPVAPPNPMEQMMPILLIGGLGIGAFLLLKRKPQSNPARGRRRRRRHHRRNPRRIRRRRR